MQRSRHQAHHRGRPARHHRDLRTRGPLRHRDLRADPARPRRDDPALRRADGGRLSLFRRHARRPRGRICLCGRLPAAAGLSLHGREFGLSAAGKPPPRGRPAIAATADRRMRSARLSPDDRGDRRFRQRRVDRRAHQMRISDDRDPSRCRLQVRPLARHRDDAARAGRWRHDAAGGVPHSGGHEWSDRRRTGIPAAGCSNL